MLASESCAGTGRSISRNSMGFPSTSSRPASLDEAPFPPDCSPCSMNRHLSAGRWARALPAGGMQMMVSTSSAAGDSNRQSARFGHGAQLYGPLHRPGRQLQLVPDTQRHDAAVLEVVAVLKSSRRVQQLRRCGLERRRQPFNGNRIRLPRTARPDPASSAVMLPLFCVVICQHQLHLLAVPFKRIRRVLDNSAQPARKVATISERFLASSNCRIKRHAHPVPKRLSNCGDASLYRCRLPPDLNALETRSPAAADGALRAQLFICRADEIVHRV